MGETVAIIYNDPVPGRYHSLGEGLAVDSVIDSVNVVHDTLGRLECESVLVPLRQPLAEAKAHLGKLGVDILFNLFEGHDNESGSEAALTHELEKMNLCYTGSPSICLSVCANKAAAKHVLTSWGILTPDWQVLSPTILKNFRLSFPCIVKPLAEDASHGISVKSLVNDFHSLKEQVEFIHEAYQQPAIVEKFLLGREFTTLVVGNNECKIFPIAEILYPLRDDKPKILTYCDKWETEGDCGAVRVECPAKADTNLKQQIESLASRSFTALGCRGYARVDIRQDERGHVMVLEVNPNPDISSEGGARLQVETSGIAYGTFISEILSLAKDAFKMDHPRRISSTAQR